MKRFFTLLMLALLCCSPIYGKAVDIAGADGGTKTTSGTLSAGLRGVTFIFSADFTGSVAGTAYTGADYSVTPSIQTGDTFAAIAYVVTTGNLRIIPVR